MFRVIEPVEIDFLTATPIADTRRRIVDFLRREGGNIKVDSAKDILAGFGSSFKMRLLGVALAGTKSVPRDVVVRLLEKEGKTEVKVTVRDTAGFGTRAGFADALQQMMYQQALAIKSEFPDAD